MKYDNWANLVPDTREWRQAVHLANLCLEADRCWAVWLTWKELAAAPLEVLRRHALTACGQNDRETDWEGTSDDD